MSPKTGRPKSDNPKNIRLEIRLTQKQSEMLAKCADELNLTRTAIIVKGIEKVYQEIGQIKK